MEEMLRIIEQLAANGGGTAIFVVGGVLVTIGVCVGKRVLYFITRDTGDTISGELYERRE